MNPRTTGILFLVAATLGAFVYFYEIRGRERREAAEEADKLLFRDLELDDVAWIEFTTTDGQQVRVERREGAWHLTTPVDFPADAVALDAIVESLVEIKSEGVIEDARDPSVYGLAEDATRVRFGAGDSEHELRLGKKTPVGGNTYATADDASAVYTVESFRARSFEREFDDLRDRRPLRFDRERVDRIEVEWKDGGVVLERAEDGWRLREPLQERADETTVDTLLSDLSFLRAEGFVDDPPPPSESGLDAPSYRVVLASSEGAEGEPAARHELAFGNALDGATRAARAAETALYKVAEERYKDLPRKLNAFRYKQLTEYATSEATGFELVLREPGSSETLTVRGSIEDGAWESQPEAMSAGAEARLVSALAGLRAKDIIADAIGAEELAALQLEPGNAVITVTGEPEAEGGERRNLARLHLGTIAAGVLYAKVPGSDRVYALDASIAEDVPVSLAAFRNRFVSQETESGDEEGADEPSVEFDDEFSD